MVNNNRDGKAKKNIYIKGSKTISLRVYIDLAKPESGARIFSPHVLGARHAQARTRTRVVRLGAQRSDH